MDKHDTLLIACGTAQDRQQLRGALRERYNLLEAKDSSQLLLLLKQNSHCIAALVLAMTAPERVDKALLQENLTPELIGHLPVILIEGSDDPELLHRGFSLGAADVIPVDYEPYALLRRIETIVELHLHRQYLQSMVREQAELLRHHNDTMVDALSSIIEYRSVESGQHILRIRHFTKLLLQEVMRTCPEYNLDERSIRLIASASALHDIGKIAIPDAILMKPGRLTREEMDIMRTHAITGCRILDTLVGMADEEYLRYAHNICHYHHERWDGRGYPEGLAGEDIPICAQVVGLADVYDALTTKRVYKDAYSFAQAVNMILKGDCGVFSPKLLECFKNVTEAFENLARDYADGLSPKSESFDTALPAPKQQEENSLERIRAKYSALVHYINGLLMEVDLNRDLFHIIYNPYPELSWINEVDTFSGIHPMLEKKMVTGENRRALQDFFRREIGEFMEQDLRRSTKYFTFSSTRRPEGNRFEITLIRINPMDARRRTFAMLCRRVDGAGQPVAPLPVVSDSTLICRNDRHFTLVQLGSHVPRLAGYTPAELESLYGSRLMELILPEDRENVLRAFRTQLLSGTRAEAKFRIRSKKGEIRWISDRAVLVQGEDGQEQLLSSLTDVTEEYRSFDELNEKLRRYEIILAQTENVLFQWDLETDRLTVSDTWEKIFGFTAADSNVSQALRGGSYFHPDDLPLLLDRIGALENGSHYETAEVRVCTARGRYLWCRFRATASRDKAGKLTGIVGIIINIDTEKQAQRLLQDRADRDALTKLLNKTAAKRQAEEYLSHFPEGTPCAMLIIDLDNFKAVNDQYGHLFGDAVLKQAAREIEKLFRAQDIVARIGGDEFLVLMRGIADRQIVASRCQRLLNIFATIFRSGRQKLPLGCSIGVALCPEDGSDYYTLFNHADQALYRAKARGKNDFCFFDSEDAAMPSPSARTSALGTALDSETQPGLAEDNMVRHAFRRLYSAQSPEDAVREILAMVGQQTNVSRVYVFENSEDDRFCSNTYEWCNNGITPEIGNLQNVSYDEDIPGYAQCYDEQGLIYASDIRELPKAVYDILEPQGIKAMLHCAIREKGVLRGYIGFDDCVENRLWSREQIRLLQYFAEMLGQYLLHRRQQQKALTQAQELNTILNTQSGWLYIIEPKTFTLKYLNHRTQKQLPGVSPGQVCHRAMMGYDSPCPGCPVLTMPPGGTKSVIFRDQKHPILAEASAIQWQGEESCLIHCRRLPGEV